jgi:hypothetical protein
MHAIAVGDEEIADRLTSDRPLNAITQTTICSNDTVLFELCSTLNPSTKQKSTINPLNIKAAHASFTKGQHSVA